MAGPEPRKRVVRLLRDKVRRRLDDASAVQALGLSDDAGDEDADDIASEILLAFRAGRPPAWVKALGSAAREARRR